MTEEHVKNLFLAWSESTLGDGECHRVDAHLETCDDCRIYFEHMSAFLDRPGEDDLPSLEPDPYLPTRIRALADARALAGARARAEAVGGVPVATRRGRWVTMSAMTLMLALAITIGVRFGIELATPGEAIGETDLIEAYYEAVFQPGVSDNFDTLFENGEEESDES